jgi:cold-inducible RNA-binding protein
MNNKLFVGNLSFDTTEIALQDLFAAHGVVEDVNLVTDRVTGRPRGFAFVTMSKPEEAQAAISAVNGTNFNGRDITVTEARPREERSGGGGGGGGRGYAGGGGEGFRGGRGSGGGDRDRGPRRERY